MSLHGQGGRVLLPLPPPVADATWTPSRCAPVEGVLHAAGELESRTLVAKGKMLVLLTASLYVVLVPFRGARHGTVVWPDYGSCCVTLVPHLTLTGGARHGLVVEGKNQWEIGSPYWVSS
ncbi:hypothetical protein Taro_004890 [Colocasia esculenta]|uniref:Uncharacterized protein n=1 Tax=Colocasia esculenta TaxID=4460 RepID=A0A843TNL4_COLES|nr:hypothetical protein [Colocasia esculenta]